MISRKICVTEKVPNSHIVFWIFLVSLTIDDFLGTASTKFWPYFKSLQFCQFKITNVPESLLRRLSTLSMPCKRTVWKIKNFPATKILREITLAPFAIFTDLVVSEY